MFDLKYMAKHLIVVKIFYPNPKCHPHGGTTGKVMASLNVAFKWNS